MPYFLIHNSDGDTSVHEIDVEAFLRELNAGNYDGAKFLGALKNPDTDYWGDHTYLIIKGEITIPKPKTIVQEYTLE